MDSLHTDGKYIKNESNNVVRLLGVWKGTYTDTSTGWWGSFTNWTEQALRDGLNDLVTNWDINTICILFWIDWYQRNAPDSTAGPNTTDIGAKTAIIQTIEIAAEYGIYVQIRPFGVSSVEGRVATPYPPYHDGSIIPNIASFAEFWGDVAADLKNYPNVIFCLYDEPGGSSEDVPIWFDAADQCITAIRAEGATQLIVNQVGSCGTCEWMEDWILEPYPTTDIVFSNHIYRHHGSFEWDLDSPVDIDYIRDYLAEKNTQIPGEKPDGLGYKYIVDTYNVPIWVSAVGAFDPNDDGEYVSFWNILTVLNEWELGYVVWHWGRPWSWEVQDHSDPAPDYLDPPNRIGQAFIDSVNGIDAPATHSLSISSNHAKTASLNGVTKGLPLSSVLFEENYELEVPESVVIYTHDALFGYLEFTDEGGGYYVYLYSTGSYDLSVEKTVKAIYIYTYNAGNVKVAIYDGTENTVENLIVESTEHVCSAETWNQIDITPTVLQPDTYYIAVKTDTNNMLTSGPLDYTKASPFREASYGDPFPDPFAQLGAMFSEYSLYASENDGPVGQATKYFDSWNDEITTHSRTISLIDDLSLVATYTDIQNGKPKMEKTKLSHKTWKRKSKFF